MRILNININRCVSSSSLFHVTQMDHEMDIKYENYNYFLVEEYISLFAKNIPTKGEATIVSEVHDPPNNLKN